MKRIQINSFIFEEIISSKQIEERVSEVARQINSEYQGKKPIFIPVFNGSFMFASNLIQQIDIPLEISFVKLKSYQGMESKGYIDEVSGLVVNITNRHVIIVEDFVESGLTTRYLMDKLSKYHPTSIQIATFLYKPQKLKEENHPLKYICFSIKDEFVVGYGLDLDGYYRNLNSVYQLVK